MQKKKVIEHKKENNINKPIQRALIKVNKPIKKASTKVNKPEIPKAPVKINKPIIPKVTVKINKPVQKTPEIKHTTPTPISRSCNNQINELKLNYNSLFNNISTDNRSIITGKLTANEIFIKNDDKFINIKDFINLINISNDNKTSKSTDNENIIANSINILNDATFNGKITIKNENKQIELNPEKATILSENCFVKNVDESNNNSVININYLKKYINKDNNEFYYAYLITKPDIYPINYNNGDYILHYTSNNQVKFVLKQILINDNNVKVIEECKNIKEGTICITYDTEIKIFVYVNTNKIIDWKEFKDNSIMDNLVINKSLTLNNNKINNIKLGDKNNDIIPTIGYIESNYMNINNKEITLNKLNLPVRVPDNKISIQNGENISINYITATNIDEKNQTIPTVDYINCNYAKKSDIPDLSNYLNKEDIPIIITRNDTSTKSSDKNVYSSNKIDSLLNNTVQKITNLKITFNIKWENSSIERECEYSISSVLGTIISLNKIITENDIFEENLLNIPSLEINFDEIKDIENNTILNGDTVDIYIKDISILSTDNSISATYYLNKNKPTTMTIKDNDNNNYRTEFISIIVYDNKGHLIFNNNKVYKLYNKTITINMDNIYVCNKMTDKI